MQGPEKAVKALLKEGVGITSSLRNHECRGFIRKSKPYIYIYIYARARSRCEARDVKNVSQKYNILGPKKECLTNPIYSLYFTHS
jgi:hypothetical protein